MLTKVKARSRLTPPIDGHVSETAQRVEKPLSGLLAAVDSESQRLCEARIRPFQVTIQVGSNGEAG
jgi:hypothetical protein